MRKDTHSAFIAGTHEGKPFTAFVDGIPDKCQHDDAGGTVHRTRSGKTIYPTTFKQWAGYTSKLRDPLIIDHQNSIDDPVLESGVSCSKCGKPWEPDLYNMP